MVKGNRWWWPSIIVCWQRSRLFRRIPWHAGAASAIWRRALRSTCSYTAQLWPCSWQRTPSGRYASYGLCQWASQHTPWISWPRALRLPEEFDITDMPKYGPDSEFDEFVDKKSLRVLSIDFEGDIYNIAITCIIKLRASFNGFIDNKGIWADSEESTELKACNLQEFRDILLNYPNNSKEYHPSTYLRLLMFHLYKSGTSELCKSISKDFRNKNKWRYKTHLI